mgnify:CR=1 FL=1
MNFLAEATKEYTIQLVNILSPFLFDGFKSIYNQSKKITKKKNNVLKIFQDFIKNVSKWNKHMINNEVNRIILYSKCDFLNDLLKAVINSHIALLSNNKINTNLNNYLNISLDKFIHICYIEFAKHIYDSPYLFYDKIPSYEIEKNNKEIKNIISKSIKNAIRKVLPMKDIIKEYLEHKKVKTEIIYNKPINELSGGNNKNLNILPVNNLVEKMKIKKSMEISKHISLQPDNIKKSIQLSEYNSNLNSNSKDNIKKSIEKDNIKKSIELSNIKKSIEKDNIKISLELSNIKKSIELSEHNSFEKADIKKSIELSKHDSIKNNIQFGGIKKEKNNIESLENEIEIKKDMLEPSFNGINNLNISNITYEKSVNNINIDDSEMFEAVFSNIKQKSKYHSLSN